MSEERWHQGAIARYAAEHFPGVRASRLGDRLFVPCTLCRSVVEFVIPAFLSSRPGSAIDALHEVVEAHSCKLELGPAGRVP